jgi:hypothetical protein
MEVLTGCHCSTVDFSQKVLQPKDTVWMTFSIDTTGRSGIYRGNFVVKYKEKGKSKFDVFYASVPIISTGKFVSHPTSLIFTKAKPGQSFTQDIEIYFKGTSQNSSTVINIKAPPWMEMEVVRQSDKWQLKVSGVLPDFSKRKVVHLFVRGNSDTAQELMIPVIMESDSEL